MMIPWNGYRMDSEIIIVVEHKNGKFWCIIVENCESMIPQVVDSDVN